MLKILALGIISIGLVSCGQNKASVDCRNIGMGYNCSVTHTQGSKPINVCWELAVECVNGLVVTSTGCQKVNPSSSEVYFMPMTNIARVEKCDDVSFIEVRNQTIAVN